MDVCTPVIRNLPCPGFELPPVSQELVPITSIAIVALHLGCTYFSQEGEVEVEGGVGHCEDCHGIVLLWDLGLAVKGGPGHQNGLVKGVGHQEGKAAA